ncbi:MAG: ArsA family ATPase [Anaerolineae bacterium]
MATRVPTFLGREGLRMLLFGGKGGVGKTTVATASALYLAGQRPEQKFLIISTDPAHSLSDSFDQPIGDRPTPVQGVANLLAREINAQQVFEDFMSQYGDVMKTIADRGTYFDRQDIDDLLSLSLPGQDEMMALVEIANIVQSDEYGLVVIDAAPTGHTLRLLSLPQSLKDWLHVLESMQRKYRYIVHRMVGRYRKDEVDAFLEKMLADLHRTQSALTSSASTEFVPVTIPESMTIEETERLLSRLKELHIPVRSIVVNRVVATARCPFCQKRRREQQSHLREIEERFSSYELVRVPLWAQEVRGKERLQGYARTMLGEETLGPPLLEEEPTTAMSPAHAEWGGLGQRELILLGGKGGVGKTTVAAATAICLTRRYPGTQTLLFSTDPAHSLSDNLDTPIGDKLTPIPGVEGLFALEMDAGRLLESFKKEYVEQIDEIFDSFLKGSGMEVVFDREITEELVSATPPGVDELMALMKIMGLMDEHQFDRYILDMAPTGHALRLLETPDMVREWLAVFRKIILKYLGVMGARLYKTADLVVEKSRQLRRVQRLLIDPRRCQFIPVALAEAMSVLETQRLVERLTRLGVSCRRFMVNMVMPPTDCCFCGAIRREQQTHLQWLGTLDPDLTQIPLFPHQVVGLEGLQKIAVAVYQRGSRVRTVA